MAKRIDLTGQRFGRLVVLKYYGRSKSRTLWECKCDCNNTVITDSNGLRYGKSQSCGCYARELTSARSKTHGQSKTRLFNIWETMKARCTNPNSHKYKNYGGRGIFVCEEWLSSFEAFRDWSLSNGYQEDLTIDRIDNDGPYAPWNCRWTTNLSQSNNRSTNVFLTYHGETHSATEWARILGINQFTMLRRKKAGWTDEECIETPVGAKRKAKSLS